MNIDVSIKVLIVEDEIIVARSLEKSLTDKGYQVMGIAPSGERAFEQIARSRPDLVLMDIQLKGALDGISTAQRIQSLFDIPVVYLTAHSDQDTLKRVVHSNPYGFLLKPFRENELHETLQKALHRHASKRGTQ